MEMQKLTKGKNKEEKFHIMSKWEELNDVISMNE